MTQRTQSAATLAAVNVVEFNARMSNSLTSGVMCCATESRKGLFRRDQLAIR